MNVHSWNTTLRIHMLINPTFERYSTELLLEIFAKKREIFAQVSKCAGLLHKTILKSLRGKSNISVSLLVP